jgi:hypothetical protein
MSDEVDKLKLELSAELSKQIDERFDKRQGEFGDFVEKTYRFATDSIRNSIIIGGVLLAIASLYGIKSVGDIDSKVDSAVKRRIESGAVEKKIEEANLRERRRLLTDELDQRILKAQTARNEKGADGEISSFVTENLEEVSKILDSNDDQALKLLTLLNSALALDPRATAQKPGWTTLNDAVQKIQKGSKNPRLIQEAYKFEVSYLDDYDVNDLLDVLEKAIKGDHSVPLYISDNADDYLMLLAHRNNRESVTHRHRLKELSDQALKSSEIDWKIAGTIASSWVDGLSQQEMDKRLAELNKTSSSRIALVHFLGRHIRTVFKNSAFFFNQDYPSPEFLATIFKNIRLEESKVVNKQGTELDSFQLLSEAQSFYRKFVEKVIEQTENTEEAAIAVNALIPDFPFMGRQDLQEIPALFVKTKANPTYQMLYVGTDAMFCRPRSEKRPQHQGKPPTTGLVAENCLPLEKSDVTEWAVFFRTNPLYSDFHQY